MFGVWADTVVKTIYEKWYRKCLSIKVCFKYVGQKSTNVLGSRTAMELRGINVLDLELHEEKEKIAVYQDRLEKVTDLQKLEEAVSTYCLNAAEKIRGDNQICRGLTVFIRTSPFNKNRKYYSNSQTLTFQSQQVIVSN